MIWFYIFVFLLPFQEHYLLNKKLSGDFTVLKAYGLAMFFYAIVYGFLRGMPRFFSTLQSKLLMVFSAFLVLSMFFSSGGVIYSGRLGDYEAISFLVSALTLYVIMLIMVTNETKVRRALLVGTATLGIAGVYIIRGYLGGDDRPGWPFGDANYFALYATSVIPLAVSLGGSEKRRLVRWACYGCGFLGVIGVMLSKSRAGLITLALFGVFAVIREKKRSRGLLVLAMVGGAAAMLPSAIDRMLHPTQWDNVATELRKLVWKAAWNMTLEHPLLGVGPGRAMFMANLPGYMPVWMIAHNTYLEISAEAGIPALLAFVAMLVAGFISLRQSERQYADIGNTALSSLSRGLQGSLLAFTICAGTVSAAFLRFEWFLLFIAILLRGRVLEDARERAERKAATEPAAVLAQPAIDDSPVLISRWRPRTAGKLS